MSAIRRLLGLRSLSYQDIFGQGLDLTSQATTSGERVTRDTAMTVSAVYGSVRILADNIATLPIDSFIRMSGVRKPWRPKPRLLAWEGPFGKLDTLSQAMTSLLLEGNVYFATPRNQTGEVLYLEVLDPSKVRPAYEGGRWSYTITTTGAVLGPSQLLHVPGILLPGAIMGVSPITAAAETMGVSLAAQRYGAAFFGNSAVPSGIVEMPEGAVMSDTAVASLKASWNEMHRGSSRGSQLAVLTEGAKFNRVMLAPEEAQFLETRRFQVADVARIFGVPPHLLADSTGSTSWGSGLDSQNTAFGQLVLRPHVERLEAGFDRLMTSMGMPDVFLKLNLDAVQRGSTTERYAAYAVAIENGFMTVDEVRAKEDMPPLPPGAAPPKLPTPPAAPGSIPGVAK